MTSFGYTSKEVKNMKHVIINLFGKVQMEGFRYRVLMEARSFNIKGFVKYLRDASVEIEAVGEEAEIDNFINWCKIGPPYVSIKKTVVEEIESKDHFDKFYIL